MHRTVIVTLGTALAVAGCASGKEIRMVPRDQARVRWGMDAQAAILVLRT